MLPLVHKSALLNSCTISEMNTHVKDSLRTRKKAAKGVRASGWKDGIAVPMRIGVSGMVGFYTDI